MKIRFSRTSKKIDEKKMLEKVLEGEIASRAKEKEFEDKSTNNSRQRS
jgi:hypothetical protein